MTDEPDLDSAREYLRDAWQRSVLFLDVLRQRNAELSQLGTHSATLEDVFVTLTGRQLRE